MAQVKKKRSIWDRMAFGAEKSDGYARASLPSNRWELFWDILKGRFGKLIIINLLILLFCLPVIAILVFRYIGLSNFGATYPFMQPFGVGYQAPVIVQGMKENIALSVNVLAYAFMPLAAVIAALGFAGGAYVIRNMVWTEGIFVANDFWLGLKKNAKPMIAVGVVFSLVFYLTNISVSIVDVAMLSSPDLEWLFIICKVLAYTLLAFFSIMTMHMITMTVTYELTFKQLFKNTFMFSIAMLPQNLFFIVLAAIPLILLFFEGIFLIAGAVMFVLFSISYALLVWTDYCQWAYDKFINDKVKGAKKKRGIYDKVKESESDSLRQYREQVALAAQSQLSSRPIKPITDDELTLVELPEAFSRADLEKLRDSKQALYEDHERYVEEHKNDPKYQKDVEEQQMFEAALKERDKRIEQAKKALAKRHKNKRK
ncbi:MAG: hypothetical protein E7340_00610 [Clostridiales bacterium]|nr:hypothetical protein [Clostridiales bacterium]